MVGSEIFSKPAPFISKVQHGFIFIITHANPFKHILGMRLKRSKGKVTKYKMAMITKNVMIQIAQYAQMMTLKKVLIKQLYGLIFCKTLRIKPPFSLRFF